MSTSFKKVVCIAAAFAALSFGTGAALAFGQAQPPTQNQPPAAAQAQVARGELVSVDANAKTLTIKTAASNERFNYNDDTKVTGARGDVAGLATQSGQQVVVHFRTQGDERIAMQIELQPSK